MRKLASALLLALLAAASFAVARGASSRAAFPGRNGLLVFDITTNGGVQIYSMTPSGANVRQLTTAPAPSSQPSVSADGKRIVFQRAAAANRGMEIWTMNVDGSGQRRIAATRAGIYAAPVWSPTGKEIAYSVSTSRKWRGIWVMHSDGTHLRRITNGIDGDPAWSPNGKLIAFDRSRNHAKELEIWVVPAKGGTAKNLAPHRYGNAPDWSPDGKHIAYDVFGHGVSGSIQVMNPDGSHTQAVARFNDFPSDGRAVAWAPDGKKLVYALLGDGGPDLYMIDVTGKHRHLLPQAGAAGDPSWQPLPR